MLFGIFYRHLANVIAENGGQAFQEEDSRHHLATATIYSFYKGLPGDSTNQEDSASIYSKREQIWLTSITYSSLILVPKLISGYRLPDAWTDMEQKRRTRNEETAGLHFFTFVFKIGPKKVEDTLNHQSPALPQQKSNV